MLEPVRIFWHHVGREHVIDGYAPDIRANSAEVVDTYLAAKEIGSVGGHPCFRVDERTFVEAPPPNDSGPAWIIVYLADLGLQFSQGYKDFDGWLIDMVRIAERPSGSICVSDLFVDVKVSRSGSIVVEDLEEFALALRAGILSSAEAASAIESLGTALAMAGSVDFPGSRVQEAILAVRMP
jgi:hypothetical protein